MTEQSFAAPRPATLVEGGSESRDALATASNAPADDRTPALSRPEDRFINRELSWLDFGTRLLHLAADDRIPLFERLKFLAIFSEELDEFFEVRVAGLEDQVAAGLHTRSPDGLRPG